MEMKKALGESTFDASERAARIRKAGDCLFIKDLAVDGKDISALGASGKEIGKTLEKLLDLIYENPQYNTKDWLLNKAKSILEWK